MKKLSLLCLSTIIIFQVNAQDNDFEDDYDAHVTYADSIYQIGNDLIQKEEFDKIYRMNRIRTKIKSCSSCKSCPTIRAAGWWWRTKKCFESVRVASAGKMLNVKQGSAHLRRVHTTPFEYSGRATREREVTRR